MALVLEIVTPEKKVYSSEVDSCRIPTEAGEIGVYPSHIPLLSAVSPGSLVAVTQGQEHHLAVDKGFVQILANKISVVTQAAIDVEEINLGEVEEARKRAEEALAQAEAEDKDPVEIEQLETIVRFSLAQRLAKARRR